MRARDITSITINVRKEEKKHYGHAYITCGYASAFIPLKPKGTIALRKAILTVLNNESIYKT